jgi:hypothetical protein
METRRLRQIIGVIEKAKKQKVSLITTINDQAGAVQTPNPNADPPNKRKAAMSKFVPANTPYYNENTQKTKGGQTLQ